MFTQLLWPVWCIQSIAWHDGLEKSREKLSARPSQRISEFLLFMPFQDKVKDDEGKMKMSALQYWESYMLYQSMICSCLCSLPLRHCSALQNGKRKIRFALHSNSCLALYIWSKTPPKKNGKLMNWDET